MKANASNPRLLRGMEGRSLAFDEVWRATASAI